MKRWRNAADDEGAILILALAFLLLFALFIPVLLGSTRTNLSVSATLSAQRNEVYAAEAGLRARVETLRASTTSAVYGQSCGPITQGTFDGEQVRVQCTPQPSSGTTALTRPPYALLALPSVGSTTEGIVDQPTTGVGGGGSDIYVGGDIASNGFIQHVGNGSGSDFYVAGTAKGHSCVQPTHILTTAAGNAPICTVVATTFTDPGTGNSAYDATGGFPAVTDPAPLCLSNAVEFLPGNYTAMPTPGLCGNTKTWWFSPGLYYFDFLTGAHVLNLNGRTVVGGSTNPLNYNPTAAAVTAPTMPGSCKVDGDTPTNTGVEWLFGSDTVLSVGTANVELCPTVSSTNQEIAIRGYGAGGATGSAATTTTEKPTTNSQTPGNAYTNGTNAYAIDGANAASTRASKNSNDITVTTFANVPAYAAITKVLLRIKHQETYSGGTPTLSASVTYTGGGSTTVPVGCAANQLCLSTTSREDTLDLTSDYITSVGSTIPTVAVKFTFDNPSNGITTTEALDGIVLDVSYVTTGGFRRQSGCAVLSVANGGCDTVLSDSATAVLYVQGTVYTPLGRVDITANNDKISFNRGVIARDIVGAIHPGNGSANLFGIGRPQRSALLTAEVSTDGVTWTPRLESLVRLDDNIGSATGRGHATYLSWRVIR